MVMSSFLAGAEMITLRAPASRCLAAVSRSVNRPVLSSTKSTPRSFQGSAAGSFSQRTFMVSPFTTSASDLASTVPAKRPCTESYLRRWARVLVSVRSFTATNSRLSAPPAMAARMTFRPIRPNPLIATRLVMPRSRIGVPRPSLPRHGARQGQRCPGEGDAADPAGARLEQRPGRFGQRGSGGEDVVHQHRQAAHRSGGGEGAPQVGLALFRSERGLGDGVPPPAEQRARPGDTQRPRQKFRQYGALIITPASLPRGAQ